MLPLDGTTGDFRRKAARLFDQQMWCLGRDVCKPDGNVLLDLGMCQSRPADPQSESTRYESTLESGGGLILWGFGAMYSERNCGGVFLRRYDFAPRWTPRDSASGVHSPEKLGRLVNPSTAQELAMLRRLLTELVGWFSQYEHWIAERYGVTYREATLSARNKPSEVPANAMARTWDRIAKKCKTYRKRPTPSADPWKQFVNRLRTPIDFEGSTVRTPSTRVTS